MFTNSLFRIFIYCQCRTSTASSQSIKGRGGGVLFNRKHTYNEPIEIKLKKKFTVLEKANFYVITEHIFGLQEQKRSFTIQIEITYQRKRFRSNFVKNFSVDVCYIYDLSIFRSISHQWQVPGAKTYDYVPI